MPDDFTIGVEEEFFLVDRETRRLRSVAGDLVPGAVAVGGGEVGPELQQCQVETGTAICRTLDEVTEEVGRLRRTVSARLAPPAAPSHRAAPTRSASTTSRAG